jgi:hypothetical protein
MNISSSGNQPEHNGEHVHTACGGYARVLYQLGHLCNPIEVKARDVRLAQCRHVVAS